jgi:hypothetical protein
MSLVLRQNVDAFVNLGERDKTSGENIMSHNELISLNAALSIQAELVYHKILNILVHSFALTKELDRFDVSGCGEISFEGQRIIFYSSISIRSEESYFGILM